MKPKSDSVSNRSENTLTSTASEPMDVPNESDNPSTAKTDGMTSNTAPESISNDQTGVQSTTEAKTDGDRDGMNFTVFVHHHFLSALYHRPKS